MNIGAQCNDSNKSEPSGFDFMGLFAQQQSAHKLIMLEDVEFCNDLDQNIHLNSCSDNGVSTFIQNDESE